MKQQLAFIALLTLSAFSLFYLEKSQSTDINISAQDSQLYEKFMEWAQKFSKTQQIDIAARFPIWVENYKFVQKANKENRGFKLGMTQFADLTNEEFAELISTLQNDEQEIFRDYKTSENINAASLPSSVDWEEDVVGQVFNQGQCGGCWAYASTNALTSLNAIQSGTFTQLSVQQLIDCDRIFNKGCNGGNPIFTYNLYSNKKGMETMSDYPLSSDTNPVEQTCQYDQSKVFFTNKNGSTIKQGDVNAMKQQLTQQPLSIGINGASIYFQLYSSGVLDNTACKANLDHAVTMTGYNDDADTPYWKIKNSWGASWGEGGYIRIAIVDGDGICGCQVAATYPSV